VTIEKAQSADVEVLGLARRSGWPDELRVLIARYPREQWDAHANLGEMARFWLSRHAMFRELSIAIEQISARFRAEALQPAEFTRQFAPAILARPAQRSSSNRGFALFSDFSRGGRAVGARI